MPTKPLPKSASKTALNKKYQFLAIETKGRLDIATEKGRENIDLLQKYYKAFSNLYGAIILSDAWYLFKMAEEDITKKRHIIKKDFYAFSEVARYEDHDYFVLEIDELYEEETEPLEEYPQEIWEEQDFVEEGARSSVEEELQFSDLTPKNSGYRRRIGK